jgi:phospholipase A1
MSGRIVPRSFLLACAIGGGLLVQGQRLAYMDSHDLATRWELQDSLRNGTFLITPYKPIYVLPAVWSSAPNYTPYRQGDTIPTVPIPLDAVELKFQLSFKMKVAQGLFGNTGDLWIGYTQSSRWQVYNYTLSRPFRETNYEPEVMLSFPTDYRFLGLNGKLLTFGLVHQSNGRSDPLSRSWNRVVAQVGLERGRCTLLLRPWWRIPEDPDVDDNPGISDLMGNGEVLLLYQHARHWVSLQARTSFISSPLHGGSIQVDWSYTISGNLKAHLQVFHGYGESMIDYNHRQTTVGIGISLLEWL